MIPRTLWTAGVAVALLALIDQASAQSHYLDALPSDSASVDSASTFKQVSYSVADLLNVIPAAHDLEVAPLPNRLTEDLKTVQANAQQASVAREQALINHLQSVVASSSWIAAGGTGTMQYSTQNKTLVVTQTPAVHEQIMAALEDLRRQQKLEITMHCRLIQVPVKGFEKIRQAMNMDCLENLKTTEKPAESWIVPARGNRWTEFMNTKQVSQFTDLITKEPAAKVIKRAVVSAGAGQNVTVEAIETQFFLTGVNLNCANGQMFFTPNNQPFAIGLRLAFQPHVSADHRFVRLKMNGYWSQVGGKVPLIPVQIPVPQILDGPGNGFTVTGQPVNFQMFFQQPMFSQIRFKQKVSIPDGNAVLIHGGIVSCPMKRTDWTAWLSSLITDDDLTTWEDHHIFLLITPRIHDTQSDEQEVGMLQKSKR